MKTNRYTYLKRTAASALLLTLGFGHLNAAVIFDNLGTSESYASPMAYGSEYEDSMRSSEAQGFMTGASATTLSSLVLRLNGQNDGSGRLRVSLYSGTQSGPDSLLANLSYETIPGATGNYTFTPAFGLTLAANTPYWVVAAIDTTGLSGNYNYQDWWYMMTSGNPSVGTALGRCQNPGDGWKGPWSETLIMQVNADLSAVPEPSEWAAMSFGVLGVVWVAKRRFMPARV